MKFISSAEARKNFADTLNRVAYGAEHIAIKRSGNEFVYLISAQDYELFQQLVKEAEDKEDIAIAESRMNDPQQETVDFDEFFADLED
ncbi:MAG: type II toxin-antitoxin system Phd/YefM family antitoxin [Xenococcus sp. MO_188.B8]|nr:type II toxin-antitoxin system Phd/YefM family antitoxin [Xenococcus sp. MO_188.B8]